MPFKVLVSDSLSDEGIKILQSDNKLQVDINTKLTPEELKKVIKEYDALIVRSATKVTKEVIQAADKMKIIGRAGVGLDNVDVEAASKKGIVVVNAPGGNTISTCEHAISLILSLSRNIHLADASMKRGEWERKKFMGVELCGKTLGIVGLGRIGTEVAKRAISFGMKVLAYDPYLPIERSKQLGIALVDLKEVFTKSDYITFHTPLTDETKHLVSEKELNIMKEGVRLINCARGGIIDEEALLKAIESGKVAGAALDVYEDEPPKNPKLLACSKLVLTPHLGASTEEAQINVAIDVAHAIRDALLNNVMRNAVNAPFVDPEILKVIGPYLKLAEDIGSMQAQLTEGHIKQVRIRYVGDIVQYDLTPVSIALMKGMLTPVLQENVNFVNAMFIAKERGIRISETKTAEIQDFASLIWVEVETDKARNSIMGTLFTKVDPRIVKINEYYVDAVPKGVMLVIFNHDLPGVIGDIGTILGENKINIAEMSFGRDKPGGDAITLLNVDSDIPPKVLEKMRKAKNIKDVKVVKL